MEAKIDLVRRSVADFHSQADAARAAEEFHRVVQLGEMPADIASMPLPEGVLSGDSIHLPRLLSRTGILSSTSEANRKLEEGAVEINGERITGITIPRPPGELLIHVGRKWLRIS